MDSSCILFVFGVDAASLTDGPGNEVRICARKKERGDKLKYEFEFDADPEPDKVCNCTDDYLKQ